jgi:SAM-dependent methyltransferase
MRKWADAVMARRARRLVARIHPHLPATGAVLDVGAGTGHTAWRLRELRPGQAVHEVDVADLRLNGPRPLLFSAPHLPFADGSVAASLLLHVLHYSPDPHALLAEAIRVTRGPLVLVQSTYVGRIGWCVLRLNELAWGPLAYTAARGANFTRRTATVQLGPARPRAERYWVTDLPLAAPPLAARAGCLKPDCAGESPARRPQRDLTGLRGWGE